MQNKIRQAPKSTSKPTIPKQPMLCIY